MDDVSISKHLLKAAWILPIDQPPIHHGFIRIEKNWIASVGRVIDLPDEMQADYDWQNQYLITPGLINTHTHLELTFPERVSADGGMAAWLERVVNLKNLTTHAEKIRQIQNGLQACLQTGTTTINDISQDGACIPLIRQRGLRAQVALEFFHPNGQMPLAISKLDSVWTHCHEQAGGLITLGLSPHSPYNVHPNAWKEAVHHYQPAFIHTHLAESQAEQDWVTGQPANGIEALHQKFLKQLFPVERPCASVVTYLAENGLFDLAIPTQAAHALWCDASDINRLNAAGWGILHCPRSNLYLQAQTLNWPLWEVHSFKLGLGSDSTLSAPNLDLRAEARVARTCHGWSEEETLARLTIYGAQALGISTVLGSLTAGKLADWVIWDTSEALTDQSKPLELCLSEQTKACEVGVNGHRIWVMR